MSKDIDARNKEIDKPTKGNVLSYLNVLLVTIESRILHDRCQTDSDNWHSKTTNALIKQYLDRPYNNQIVKSETCK